MNLKYKEQNKMFFLYKTFQYISAFNNGKIVIQE